MIDQLNYFMGGYLHEEKGNINQLKLMSPYRHVYYMNTYFNYIIYHRKHNYKYKKNIKNSITKESYKRARDYKKESILLLKKEINRN